MLIMAMKKHGDVSAGAILINEGDGGPTEKRTILQMRGHFFFHKGHISLKLGTSLSKGHYFV